MDALGKDIIFVETVGAGQVELDIVRAADTVLVVLNPGAGDEIQAMKAGILEGADIFVINKADRDGADRLGADLSAMLAMKVREQGDWTPPVILTEATRDRGTAELAEAISGHHQYLVDHGKLPGRRRERVRLELFGRVEAIFRNAMMEMDETCLAGFVDAIFLGRTNHTQAAGEIVRRLVNKITEGKN
ncbi:MAG: hypothetical protein A2Z29_09000 [Chloroflexi bacterium RBG_16_56_11]|nr:MAG: hypothetical protein A2Z29_09000 [Chloroflexi bacterium RBG_16_56_11]